jgi:methyltransferase (TIGR00027 family)
MKEGKLKEGKASWSAEVSAAYRAAEWEKPENERICYDPIAQYFLGFPFTIVGRSPPPIGRVLTKIAIAYAERLTPGNPGYVVSRTRYIDDYLSTCINEGIEQLVILGAGYDSRAYRFEELKGKVKVFEVDHPATQKAKMRKVEKAFGSPPEHVAYIGIDFDKESLDERMFQSEYRLNLKTLFIWEGVSMFITVEGVDATLDFVRKSSGEGSSIIFDYILKSVLDGTCEYEEAEKWRSTCESIGEPYTFGIEKSAIGEFISERGFHRTKDIGTDFLRSAYIEAIDSKRKMPRHYRIVHAMVRHEGLA